MKTKKGVKKSRVESWSTVEPAAQPAYYRL